MPLKKNSCQSWKLLVITDPTLPGGRDLVETVRLAVKGGASAVQLRDKSASDEELKRLASALLKITRPSGVPLIINDRAEVAAAVGADGLHLGQNDGDLLAARRLLGESSIIGRSTHSRAQALTGVEEGADYIGIGPVFRTPTKSQAQPVGLDLVSFAAQNIKLPFVAIGGIDEHNAEAVRRAGARCIAVVRAVIRASDPKKMTQNLLRIMIEAKNR